jgi:hypothetical protein
VERLAEALADAPAASQQGIGPYRTLQFRNGVPDRDQTLSLLPSHRSGVKLLLFYANTRGGT